ncbi:MAG: hypothetical protein IRZ20_01205 [Thermoleophilia bacterium]|nr:hypothetical protein [Thermoleophilia bacterium]
MGASATWTDLLDPTPDELRARAPRDLFLVAVAVPDASRVSPRLRAWERRVDAPPRA